MKTPSTEKPLTARPIGAPFIVTGTRGHRDRSLGHESTGCFRRRPTCRD